MADQKKEPIDAIVVKLKKNKKKKRGEEKSLEIGRAEGKENDKLRKNGHANA